MGAFTLGEEDVYTFGLLLRTLQQGAPPGEQLSVLPTLLGAPGLAAFAMPRLPRLMAASFAPPAVLAAVREAVEAGVLLPAVAHVYGAWPRLASLRPNIESALLRCGYSAEQVAAALAGAPAAAAAGAPAAAAAGGSDAAPFAGLLPQVWAALNNAGQAARAAMASAAAASAAADAAATPAPEGAGGRAAAAAAGEAAAAAAAAGADAAPAVVVHERVECDACGTAPVVGVRYKCSVCRDYDLCAACERANSGEGEAGPAAYGSLHDGTHPFLKIVRPEQTPAAIMTVLREDHEAGGGHPFGSRFGHGAGGGGEWRRGGGRCGRWRGGGGGGACGMSGLLASAAKHAAAGATVGEAVPAPAATAGGHPWAACGGGFRGGRGGHRGGFGGGWRRAWEAAAASDLRNGPTAAAAASADPSDAGGNVATGTPVNPLSVFAAAEPVAAAAAAAAAPGAGGVEEDEEERRLVALAIRESLASVAASAGAGPVAAAAADPQPAPAARQQLRSRFVAHLTYTDQSVVAPGSKLIKAWRLKNAGASAWPEGTRLLCVGGHDAFTASAPRFVPVPQVLPGATVDIAVPLTAPAASGRYQAYFRLAVPSDAAGAAGARDESPTTVTAAAGAGAGAAGRADRSRWHRFGHRVWADIFVEDPSSSGTEVGAAASAASSASEHDGEGSDAESDGEHDGVVVDAAPAAVPAAKAAAAPAPAAAEAVSAGGAVVGRSFLTAAHGNSNAAAVLAALAAGASEEDTAAHADDEADEAAALTAATAVSGGVAPPAPSAPPAAAAAPPAPAAAAVAGPERWAFHLASLAGMGFGDEALNVRLLDEYAGNLMRVVNQLLEAQVGAPQ